MGNLHGLHGWGKKKVFNGQKNFVSCTTDVTARSSAYEVEIVGQERRGTSVKETDAGRERTLREDSKAVRETDGNEGLRIFQ